MDDFVPDDFVEDEEQGAVRRPRNQEAAHAQVESEEYLSQLPFFERPRTEEQSTPSAMTLEFLKKDLPVGAFELANTLGLGRSDVDPATGLPGMSLPAKAYGAMEALRPMGMMGKHFARPEQEGLDFGQRYEQGKQRYLEELGAAREMAPNAAGTGGITGVLGQAVLPGPKVAAAGQGASALARAGSAALEGAKGGAVAGGLAGAGAGEGAGESLFGGVAGGAGGALFGGGLGGAAGAAGTLLSRAAGKIFDPAGKLGRLIGAADAPPPAPAGAPRGPGGGQGALAKALGAAEYLPMGITGKIGLKLAKQALKPAVKAEAPMPDWMTGMSEAPAPGSVEPSGLDTVPPPESPGITKWTTEKNLLPLDDLKAEMSMVPEYEGLTPGETIYGPRKDVTPDQIVGSTDEADDLDLYVDPIEEVGKSAEPSYKGLTKGEVIYGPRGEDPALADTRPSTPPIPEPPPGPPPPAAGSLESRPDTPSAKKGTKKKYEPETDEGLPEMVPDDLIEPILNAQRRAKASSSPGRSSAGPLAEKSKRAGAAELQRLLHSTETRYRARGEIRENPEIKVNPFAKSTQINIAALSKKNADQIAELARAEDQVPEVVMWAETLKPRSQREFGELTGLSWEHEIEPILIQKGVDLNQFPKDHRVRGKGPKKGFLKEAAELAMQGVEEVKSGKTRGMAVIPGWKKPGSARPANRPTQAPKTAPKQVGPDPSVKGPQGTDPYLMGRIRNADAKQGRINDWRDQYIWSNKKAYKITTDPDRESEVYELVGNEWVRSDTDPYTDGSKHQEDMWPYGNEQPLPADQK